MSDQETTNLTPQAPEAPDPSAEKGPNPGDASMKATNGLAPIVGTNGYQQLISFDRTQPLNLSVTNASGTVRVTGSDQEGVWVVVRRSDGEDAGAAEDIPVTINVDGNSISVHPDWGVAGGFASLAKKIKDQLQHGLNPSDWDLSSLRLNPDLSFDIRVEIPSHLIEGSKVSLKTASGAVTVANLQSNVSAVTASGRIEASNLAGNISTHSASGAISIDGVEGSLDGNSVSGSMTIRNGTAWMSVRSVSGRIELENLTLKNARVASVSGGVRASIVADNPQSYSFSTVSGSVKLNVTTPAGVTTKLASRSASGSAQADGEWVSTGRKAWSLGSGEPGPVFDVKTVSGSLKATGQTSPSVTPRDEPLPELQMFMENQHDLGHHGTDHTQSHGMPDVDMNIEGISNWAKDFARDFKRNFASLATPPEPDLPANPEAPAAPQAPQTPPAPQAPTAPVPPPAAASPSEPWTWSTTSGTPPPSPSHSHAADAADEAAAEADEIAAAVEEAAAAAPERPSTVAAVDATPTREDDERLRVLEALERGEIDIDEALTKLDPGDTPRS